MKVLEEIMREVDNVVKRRAPQASRKYNKITQSIRVKFLDKIIFENKSIKKAAEEMNINYSSAKSILTTYRRKHRNSQQNVKQISPLISSCSDNQSTQSCNTKQCRFRQKTTKDQIFPQNFQIITSLGGNMLNCQDLSIQQKLVNIIRLKQLMNSAYYLPNISSQLFF